MAKCLSCDKEYEAKRSTSSYCSPACKQAFYRNRAFSVTDQNVTVTNRGYTLKTTVPMTDFEREHYKPASQLAPGEHSPVSKPGDKHYPKQSGLNTCNRCGCELKWDVLDCCLTCVLSPPTVLRIAKQGTIV